MSDAARLGSDALVAQRRFLISPDWRLWAIVGVLAIIDIIWVQLTPLTIQWWIYAILLMVAGCCLAWWCAGLFFRMSDGPRRLASIVAFSWISAAAVQLCSILLMTLPFPIADPVLARWDEALGLDWVAYATWLGGHPWISELLYWVYATIVGVSLLTIIVLHFLNQERAAESVSLQFTGGIIAVVIGSAFPAMGAPTYHQAPLAVMAAFPAHSGAQWTTTLEHLRSGLPAEISPIGLVSFPSYHIAWTMIIAWSFRGYRLFPLFVAYGVATVAATPIFGGHYFVDMIAGAGLAGALILGRSLWRKARTRRG
jgi:hypothetical protein